MDYPATKPPGAPPSPTSAAGARPRRLLGPWALVFLMLVAVFGPSAAIQIPREVGRWQLAQAIKLRGEGEKVAANEKLAAAIEWFPKSAELHLTRAEWLLEDGQREDALAAADEMLEAAGDTYESLLLHGQFLQNTGEFARAVDDWKEIAKQSEVSGRPNRATALNGLAYAQSLAEVELDDALKHVNEALESQPAAGESRAAMLDTRAYVLYLQAKNSPGDESKELLDKGLADMNIAVRTMDAVLAKSPPKANADSPETRPKEIQAVYDALPKTLREMADNNEHSSAVMHYHRALILEALDRKKEAEAERAVVRRLIGREPDKTLF